MQPDVATQVVALANAHLEGLQRILSVEEKQTMEVKAEIAKKVARGEIVSNKYLERHNKNLARVIGHTAIGDIAATLVTKQEGSESWSVIVTVDYKRFWVEYKCGRHIPYKQHEFNAQFTTGSENDLPTVGATVNHPVYKEGRVTHVIIDYTMEHECTAFIDNRRRPTKPWECSCVRFVNTQEHCDGLMHLLLTIFRTDPLDEKSFGRCTTSFAIRWLRQLAARWESGFQVGRGLTFLNSLRTGTKLAPACF